MIKYLRRVALGILRWEEVALLFDEGSAASFLLVEVVFQLLDPASHSFCLGNLFLNTVCVQNFVACIIQSDMNGCAFGIVGWTPHLLLFGQVIHLTFVAQKYNNT